MKKNKILRLSLCIVIVFLLMVFLSGVKANEIDFDEVAKVAANGNNTTNSTKKEKNPDDSNALLKSLSIDGYDMYPEFNKNTTMYYVSIPLDVKSLEINAETEVESSKIKKSGDSSLVKTENTIYVTVTSKDNTMKRYTIIATKQKDNGLKLSELTIEGAELNPSFSENKYYYNTNIELIKSDEIPPLNIIAKSNSDTAEIEILGNSNLTEGENLITILLKDKDDYTSYQINANISTKTMITTMQDQDGDMIDTIKQYIELDKNKIMEWFEDENRRIATFVASGVVLFIIVLSIIISKIKKHKAERKVEKIKRRAK